MRKIKNKIRYMWNLFFSGPLYGIAAGVGITGGAHRLWAHRSYSAKVPLRILLAYLYCMAGQVSTTLTITIIN